MTSNKTTKKEEPKVQLDLIHGFGSLAHSGLKGSFTFVEDDGIKLGFPMGKQFAIRSTDRAEMSFIGFHENLENISSICVSKNRKYFAVSGTMKGETCPQLTIYPVRADSYEQERTFKYTESKSSTFVHMCFGEDPRFLVMLTGSEDSHLVFLDTSRMKPMGTMGLNAKGTRVSISPRDNHIVAVSGDKVLKTYRVQENNFRYLGDIENLNTNQKFTEHVWTDDNKLLVANDQARIYVISNQQVLQILSNCFNLNESDPFTSVTALVAFSRGFAIGGDNGTFTIWIKNDDVDPEEGPKNYFTFLRTRKGPPGQSEAVIKKAGIVSLDVSPTEDMLAVSFKNNDLATVTMNQLVPSTADVVDPYKLKKLLEKDIQFDYLYNGFHNGPISGIDICVQRPLIATCSTEDSTIRLWNYVNFRCELAVMFSVKDDKLGEISPVLSLSLHPAGYYLAVGFVDRLEIFHICSEELRSYRIITQVKNVNCVKFSRAGHMLAVAYPRPSHTNFYINIYNSFTMESLTLPLKGPIDAIKELIWTNNDETLICCGVDGSICEWNVRQDFTKKDYSGANAGLKFTDITVTSNGNILACGSEKGDAIVKQIQPAQNIQKNYPLDFGSLKQLVSFRGNFNTQGLIGGTDQGSITIFPGNFEAGPYDYMPAHLSEIIKIIVSPDGKYVFSAGKDQCILIYQAKELSSEGPVVSTKDLDAEEDGDIKNINPYAHAVDDNLADVVLVSQEEIDKFKSEIKTLRLEVEDLHTRMEIAAEEDRRRTVQVKARAEQSITMTVESWQRRCEDVKAQKVTLEKEYENLLKLTEANHYKAIEDLEALYDKKLAYETEKLLQLEQEIVEEENKLSKKEKKAQRRHHDTIDRLEGEYKEEFFKTQRVFETNKNTAEEIKSEYEAKLDEIEEEHENEVKELKINHDREMAKLDDELSKLTEENVRFKIDSKDAKSERERMKKTEEEKMGDLKQLNHKLNEQKTMIETLNKTLGNRRDAVEDKKKKIEKYKVKINDMQKSKHVLSFQTTEMKKSLEPKEAQIEKMKEEVMKLRNEFESMLKTSQEQNDKLMKKEKKIENLQSESDMKTAECMKKDFLMQRIVMDIFNAISTKEEREYAGEMKKLYRTYCAEMEIKDANTSDPRGIKEMLRQIQYLEKSIFQMNRDTEKVVKRKEQDIHRKTNENSDLICDLNNLKKANKRFESQILSLSEENNILLKKRKALIDERNDLRVTIAELNKGPGSHQNLLAKLSPVKPTNNNLTTSHSSPMLKLKNHKSATSVGEEFVSNMKAQSVAEKNKLSEYMAELDIYNQKLMQQEREFNQLFGDFQKQGIDVDDEMRQSHNDKPFELYRITEGDNKYELEENKIRKSIGEHLHSMKPKLNVQVPLTRSLKG